MAYSTQMSSLKKTKYCVLITSYNSWNDISTKTTKQWGYILMRIITTTLLVSRHKLCYSNILCDDVWNSYYWSTRLQYFAYTLEQSHLTYPSSGCYSLAVVAVHLLKLCCSLCCDPDYLQHAFFALISALNGYSITYVIHSLGTSCSELEWVWNSADYWQSRQFQVHVVLRGSY